MDTSKQEATSLEGIDFQRLRRCLAALSDPTRQKIVSLVSQERLNVGDLTERLSLSQPAVSHHLRVLADAGVLRRERQGRERVYRLDTKCCEGIATEFRKFMTRCCANARCC